MAGLKLRRWVFSLLCRWFPGRVRVRRRPVVLSFKPQLEGLEIREMLDAASAGQAASALWGDLAHLNNDLATAKVALVNTVRTTPTNAPTLVSVANQLNKVESVLAADYNQTRQALIQFGYDALGEYQQGLETLLADVLGFPSEPSQGSSPLTAFQTTYPLTPPRLTQPNQLWLRYGGQSIITDRPRQLHDQLQL